MWQKTMRAQTVFVVSNCTQQLYFSTMFSMRLS